MLGARPRPMRRDGEGRASDGNGMDRRSHETRLLAEFGAALVRADRPGLATSSAWPGAAPVTRDGLIARTLAFPAAGEDCPFGDDLLAVKVGRRVFAWIPLGYSVRAAFKLPPQTVAELRSTYRDQVRPARPLKERYWLTIPIGAGIPDSVVADLLAAFYEEVVRRLPKRSRPDRSDRHGS